MEPKTNHQPSAIRNQKHLAFTRVAAIAILLVVLPACYGGRAVQQGAAASLPGDLCEKARPLADSATLFARTNFFRDILAALQRAAAGEVAVEYITAFGREPDGNIIASPLTSGGRYNSSIPAVRGPFADLHNHPGNTPPSSGDLYGLIRKAVGNSQYNTRYVVTPSGTLYALVVTDTAAAAAFLRTCPPQQVPGFEPLFPEALLDEYREILYRYHTPEDLTLAFMLEKYATGVALLKADTTGTFVVLRTKVSGKGEAVKFNENPCRQEGGKYQGTRHWGF